LNPFIIPYNSTRLNLRKEIIFKGIIPINELNPIRTDMVEFKRGIMNLGIYGRK